MIRREQDLVLAARVHEVDQLGREVLRRVRRRHQVQVLVLDHQADRDVPPRIGAVRHHDDQLGQEVTDLVEVHRVLAGARHRRAGEAGVDRDRELPVDALGVEREVAVVGRCEPADHEGRHARQHDRLVLHESFEFAYRLHAATRIDGDREHEAIRVLLGEGEHLRQRVIARERDDRLLDAGRIHLRDELVRRETLEDAVGALEIVFGDALQELGRNRRRPCWC